MLRGFAFFRFVSFFLRRKPKIAFMNQPENMTLGSMLEGAKSASGPDAPNKVPENESSLSDRFSFPGRIAVLLAVLFSPWALASVRFGPQCTVMVLLLIGLAFWWFETAFHERQSQVFPYVFFLLAAGLLIGIVQIIPLPSWLIELLTGRQPEIYRGLSDNPDATVTISLDREGTWQQIRLMLIAISGLLLGCRFFRTNRDALLLLWAVTINGGLIAFVSIFQKAMGLPYGLYSDLRYPLLHFGPFVNPNNAAGYLLLCLAAAVGLLVITMTKPKNEKSPDVLKREMPLYLETYYQLLEFISRLTALKIGLLLIIGLLTCGIVASLSRGGVLALFAGTLATLLVYGVARKPKNSVFVFVPVLGLFVASVAWWSFGDALADKFEDVDVVNVADADVRLAHWRETASAIGEMGPLGSGLGSYKNVHRLYRSSNESAIFVYAENQFFQAVVEAGWPGLLLFCLAWILVFQCASLLIFKGNSPFSIGIGTAAVFLIFTQAIASCFDFGFYIGANLVLIAVSIGFICCHAQYLAGRLKKFSWLKYAMPNYVVKGIVLGLFAISFVACLDLFRLARMDSLMRPRSSRFDRENMSLDLTNERIEKLESWILNPLFSPLDGLKGNAYSVAALNHLGELHLHRSRLVLFQEMKQNQSFGFAVGAAELSAEEKRADDDRLWDFTDVQRIQENASHLKHSQSRFLSKEFLSKDAIQNNLPFALKAFQLSVKASPLQPLAHLRIGEIKGALDNIRIGSGDQDIERCLELAPGNSNFRLVAGVHYLQSNKPLLAVPHLRRCLELNPNPKNFKKIMRILGGRDTRSINYLDPGVIGLELIPNDPKMIFDFAAKQMPDDSEHKLAVLQRAAEILDQMPHRQRDLMILSGDIALEKGDFEKATADYQLALVSQPNDNDLKLKLAICLTELDKEDAALAIVQELKLDSPSNYRKIEAYLNNRNGFGLK